MRRCSDRRLLQLVKKALYALEDPAAGFVFDDFDLRYREAERKREADSARWFYRDKMSFETKYEADCGREPCNEPAWVSDGGRGAFAHYTVLETALDQKAEDPFWLRLWRQKRLALKPRHRAVLDALALDWRTVEAARLSGQNRKMVQRTKIFFKTHFAQCYTAWKRDFNNR